MVDLLKRLMEANRTTGSQITTGDTRPGRTPGSPPHRNLPPLRHPDPQGRPAQLRRRTGHLLVPHLPAEVDS